MKAFWITFEDGTSGCCEGQSEYDAKLIAKHIRNKEVKTCEPLPYPSSPRVWEFVHPVYGVTPSFCCSPKSCKGNSSCPKSYSCTE